MKIQSSVKRSLPIAVLFVFMIAQISFAQVAGGFYSGSGDTKVAIGYDFSSKVWTDLRMYGGVSLDNFTPELSINYNFVQKEIHDVYTGLGVSVNGRNSLFIPFGFRVKPFENFRNLSLIAEAEPMYNIDTEELAFVCFFGMRYNFKARDK